MRPVEAEIILRAGLSVKTWGHDAVWTLPGPDSGNLKNTSFQLAVLGFQFVVWRDSVRLSGTAQSSGAGYVPRERSAAVWRFLAGGSGSLLALFAKGRVGVVMRAPAPCEKTARNGAPQS